MFLYLDPWFPVCRRLKNIFQQSWVCTASVTWELGLGKCHTSWCNFIVADSIPNEGSWSLTCMLTSDLHCKKQYLNKRQVSLSLELHCKPLWTTPTWPLRSPVSFNGDPSSSITQRAWCQGKMAAYVISIMQRINVQKQKAQVLIPAPTRGSPADTEGGTLPGGPHGGLRPWQVGGHTARVIAMVKTITPHILMETPGCVFDMVLSRLAP